MFIKLFRAASEAMLWTCIGIVAADWAIEVGSDIHHWYTRRRTLGEKLAYEDGYKHACGDIARNPAAYGYKLR